MTQPMQRRKLSWWLKGWEEAGLARRWEGHTTGSEFWSTLSPPREPLNWRIWLNRTARAFLKSIRFSVLHERRRIEFVLASCSPTCVFLFFCIAPITLCFFFFSFYSLPFNLWVYFSFKSLPPSHFLFLLIPNSSCLCILSLFSPRFSLSPTWHSYS